MLVPRGACAGTVALPPHHFVIARIKLGDMHKTHPESAKSLSRVAAEGDARVYRPRGGAARAILAGAKLVQSWARKSRDSAWILISNFKEGGLSEMRLTSASSKI